MKIKVENKPDQIIDFKYNGDTEDIKEDVIRANIDEIKRLTLKKITGKEDVEHLMKKFKIRKGVGGGTEDLLPTNFNSISDQDEKNSILSHVFEILNDPETTLSLVHQPLPAAQFAQGSLPVVGVAKKDTHGKMRGGSIHKKSKKKRSRKKKSKRSRKRRSKRRSKKRSRKLHN